MKRVAVLASGGLDSSVLVAELAGVATVFPIYVAMGLAWEREEQSALSAFLARLPAPAVQPLTTLTLDIAPLYGRHWSLTGHAVPGADTPDEAVYLPGRNVLLLGLAAVWCATHDVGSIAVGTLDDNPFADASPGFFEEFADVLGRGLSRPLEVLAPYRGCHKSELVKRFAGLPLQLTLTCLQPGRGRHCGRCNKCAERRRAFSQAGVPDPTRYSELGA